VIAYTLLALIALAIGIVVAYRAGAASARERAQPQPAASLPAPPRVADAASDSTAPRADSSTRHAVEADAASTTPGAAGRDLPCGTREKSRTENFGRGGFTRFSDWRSHACSVPSET